MFDPFYAGVVLRSDVKHWEVVRDLDQGSRRKQRNGQFGSSSNYNHNHGHQKKIPKIYVVVVVQKKLHAMLLEPHVNDEEIMIDRLKFLCGIQPRYMAQINVCLSIIDGVEVVINYPISYNMVYVPFMMGDVDVNILNEIVVGRKTDIPKLEFMPDVDFVGWLQQGKGNGKGNGKEKLGQPTKSEEPEELEQSMELEICKILIFWYIAGVSRPSEEMLLVRMMDSIGRNNGICGNRGGTENGLSGENNSGQTQQKTVISGHETLAGSKRFALQLIEKYMDDDDTVRTAQKLVTKNIDMDHVRGIVCGTREMTRDVRNRSNLKLSVDYKLYLERFELRCEFAVNSSPQELRDRMLVLDGELILG